MATTTAVASYRAAGQPDDAVGAVGDTCFDTLNRITWVKQPNNTWVGGGYSNIGPTGPAQLSGTGDPAAGFGQIGNGYTDQASGATWLKSSSGWAKVGTTIGPQGVPGPITLTSQSATNGPTVGLTGNTLSATPTPLAYVGSSLVHTIAYGFGTAFMGGLFVNNSGASVVFNLTDLAAGATLYSVSVAANSLLPVGQFSTAAYPMPQGRSYQWQVTGTAAVTGIYINPLYLLPAVTPSYSVGQLAFCGRSSATTTYTNVYTALFVGAVGSTNYSLIFRKPTSLYYVTCYNQTNAALSFGMANFTAGNYLWQQSVPANTTQSFGPFVVGAIPFTVGSTYYWAATGNGTGAAYVDGQVVYSAA